MGDKVMGRQGDMTDSEAMDRMAEVMSGKEWSPDTLEDICSLIKRTGRKVEEYQQDEEMTEEKVLERGWF